MRVLYFAAVRDAVGVDEEEVSPPAGVGTLGDLVDWLSGRSEAHARALADRGRLRGAVDQVFANFEAPIASAREVALFPPVTGG
ncbi:molybdopterin converting factor subunit 1 [Sphingomonas sp. ID0503]|uniref:molybdopterin converting factor subunit 1 n=1 Tax=Sphingomonas sp. ID0503 TaxID=3399691 RepID=UPI003AFB6E0C